MIKFLKDISYSGEHLAAFQADPESFLDRYDAMTPHERALILSGDSSAISGYINDPSNQYGGKLDYRATTTIVTVVAVILAPKVEASETTAEEYHDGFWSHVAERSAAFAH
ncbi:hypothetical protein [Pseudoruegeria sp. HB172150]|uniref:hypothetical protein n=1 Tax=Pseudoruegeria sp. HB172150 TaxID=2721164 RepID=UPI001557A5A1|nr:hypothetical protein [Pseudoruegeria sp. HB172150]